MIGVAVMLLAAGAALGDVFNIGSGLTSLETVHVGDPHNVADNRTQSDGTSGYGSVSYEYNIGKYEVTAGQYAEFLNAVGGEDTYSLYSLAMASTISGCGLTRGGSGTIGDPYTYSVTADFVNRPVNYTSFWDACRFANWLTNGQPTGEQNASTTERGTYTLDGYNGYDGRTIHRSANAKWAATSEDEWYKAAYYKGGTTNAGYWDYPISSNSIDTGKANYVHSAGFTTNVGSYAYPSPYGTFDQGGNVWEWTEGIVAPQDTYVYRALRGGAYYDYSPSLLASFRFPYTPPSADSSFGFRVSEVPEPVTTVLLVLCTAALQRRPHRMNRRRATNG